MLKPKRKNDDDADGNSGAGVSMHAEPVAAHNEPVALDQARALLDVARRGGSVTFVARSEACPAHRMIALRDAGLIETQEQIDGNARVRLTAFGVQRLTEAAKLVANTPGVGR